MGLNDERSNGQARCTKDRTRLALPESGKLAEIDPVLIVTPPRGMEAGCVPLATRRNRRRSHEALCRQQTLAPPLSVKEP